MATAIKATSYTFEDFCVLIREDQKADLIDGVIHVASPENTEANKLFGWLYRLLGDFIEAGDLGDLFGSRVAFRLDDVNSPEPDLAFVRKSRRRLVLRGRVNGPPDLAVEIVSPESVDRDYEDKRAQYEKAGVKEYWIVDDLREKVTLLRLSPKKKYREVRPRKGELHSQVLPGFWLRSEWLWQEPRPKKDHVLALIRAKRL
jgi:Uma2 family endonuclease